MTPQEYSLKRNALMREIDAIYEKVHTLDNEYLDNTTPPYPIGTNVRVTLENTPETFCPAKGEGAIYTVEGYVHGWELNHDDGELRPDILTKGGKRRHYYFYHPIIKIEEINEE